MTRTPDEIKRELDNPIHVHYHISDIEPRLTPLALHDLEFLHADALALIKQLEAQNAELLEKVEKLKTERDAALADFKLYRERNIKGECGVYACDLCKLGGRCEDLEENKCPTGCTGVSHWEWRGVQKEE